MTLWKLCWWKYLPATYHQCLSTKCLVTCHRCWAWNVWRPPDQSSALPCGFAPFNADDVNWSWQWFWCWLWGRWKECGFEPGPECRCPSWQIVCSASCNRPVRKQLLLSSRSNHLQPSWQWVCILPGEPHAASQGRQRGRSGLYIFAYSAVTET